MSTMSRNNRAALDAGRAVGLHFWRYSPRASERGRSAALITRIRALAVTVALLVTACSAYAGFAGFEVGNGVALTGGVVRVNYMGNKSRSIALGPKLRLRLMEVQLTMANVKVKRHTMVIAGTHVLRAPLPIELVEVLGPLCLLALVWAIIPFMRRPLSRGPEPGAPPNGGPAMPPGNSKVSEGPPSVS
jgi:hypothetical protein